MCYDLSLMPDVPGLTIIPEFVPEHVAEAIEAIVDTFAEGEQIPGTNGIDHVQRLLLRNGSEMEIVVGNTKSVLWMYDAVLYFMGGCDSIIATRYQPGATLDEHTDPGNWSDTICVFNIGHEVTIEFRKMMEGETVSVMFPDRALMVMSGPARYEYLHGIRRVEGERIAVVCRKNTTSS